MTDDRPMVLTETECGECGRKRVDRWRCGVCGSEWVTTSPGAVAGDGRFLPRVQCNDCGWECYATRREFRAMPAGPAPLPPLKHPSAGDTITIDGARFFVSATEVSDTGRSITLTIQAPAGPAPVSCATGAARLFFWSALKLGTLVRSKASGNIYVVTAHLGNRALAVKAADITNPDEWEIVADGRNPDNKE